MGSLLRNTRFQPRLRRLRQLKTSLVQGQSSWPSTGQDLRRLELYWQYCGLSKLSPIFEGKRHRGDGAIARETWHIVWNCRSAAGSTNMWSNDCRTINSASTISRLNLQRPSYSVLLIGRRRRLHAQPGGRRIPHLRLQYR